MKVGFIFKATCVAEAGNRIDAGKYSNLNRPLRWELKGPGTNKINLYFLPRIHFSFFNRKVPEAREGSFYALTDVTSFNKSIDGTSN